MLAIALLIIGIIGFVKGRISVTSKRELRGGGLYAVATLFCLPLPLSFLAGVAAGAAAASGGKPVDDQAILWLSVAAVWGPILVAFILAFALAKPKVQAPTGPQGFEVKM
jgi:hypothetical protein